MNKTFVDWYKETEAMRKMEWQIIEDKLKQGVNGIEWLVLNIQPKESRQSRLGDWFETLQAFGCYDTDSVMRDALVMGADSFYEKHKINWWIAVSNTLTYLHAMKQHSYDRYFAFLEAMEKEGERI